MNQFLPNLAPTKYYSSNDAMIIIGDIFVDEAVAISYSARESKIPIYGYNSKYFNRVAPGKVLVQGTITINYIDDEYFNNILLSSQEKQASKNNAFLDEDDFEKRGLDFSNIFSETGKVGSQNMLNFSKALANNPLQRQQILSDIQKRKAEFREKIYGTKDLDEVLEKTSYAGRRRASTSLKLFHDYGPVNILVSHNNPFVIDNNVARIIEGVHILGLEHVAQPVGQPQVETYSFFANKLI